MDTAKKKKTVGEMEEKEKFDCGVQSERNVSFSFNLDLDNMSEDLYSDSDAGLEIDVSEIDDHETPNSLKRKRESTDLEISVFNQMEEEIERQLDAKAARTNLTAKNVKNILKHVISNEHVMAMVKRKAYNLKDDNVFEPKLTRAKAKELAMAQPDIPWPITPLKKLKGSEVQVLIEKELSEDSSDEEYHPGQEEPSDDEREAENLVSSDLDSQPSTPATPPDLQLAIELQMVDVRYDEGGVFKLPELPAQLNAEGENIGQRTRSKFSLSETPLEQIEQAFVPPDITTDMYDWGWDADEDWNEFLKDFTQPLTQEIVGEDDPEADPEYNILDDEETELLDKEELRMDKAVKVTRKELNNLVAELFEFADMFSKQNQDVTKKKKSHDTLNSSSENNPANGSVIELLPVLAEDNLPKLVNSEQRQLLEVQVSQHVQLMAQHFVMTHMHPELQKQAKTCKDNLNSLRYLSSDKNSAFNAPNLTDALSLVDEWERKLQDSQFRQSYVDSVEEEIALDRIAVDHRTKYIPRFHPEIEKLFLESRALIFPQLLPDRPFRCGLKENMHQKYLPSEERLIVLGLDQFMPFVKLKRTKFKANNNQLMDTVQLIRQYLVPNRDLKAIVKHINIMRKSPKWNPIQEWFKTEKAPAVVHCILRMDRNDFKAPKQQPIDLLSKEWQNIAKGLVDTRETGIRKRMLRIYESLMKPSSLDINGNSRSSLLNPTVNMLPTMPSLNTPIKSNTSNEKSNKKLLATGQSLEKLTIASGSPSTSGENRSDFQYPIQHTLENVCVIDVSAELENLQENIADKIPDMEMIILSPKTNSDCMSPRDAIECDEHPGADSAPKNTDQREAVDEQTNVPETMDKPQLRKTTPRLAKIRSAQNMKMMAQILGNKGPSQNTTGVKPRGKRGSSKRSDEPSTSSNGDNEDEIAELMLASTTIKKDTAIRKRAKQARELENIKRLVEAENDLSQEERATKFAVSFLQKLHKALDPNAEVFKAIVKLFLYYNEKIDTLNQTENEEQCQSQQGTEDKNALPSLIDDQPSSSRSIVENPESIGPRISKDTLTMGLYRDVCAKLVDYPELRSDFLLFLKPHQAAMIGKSVEHTMLQKMNDFVYIAQIYFAKQPSRLSKVMQAITQLASDTRVSLERVNSVMGPLLKGHPLVMDTFLQVLPNGKPPESLFAPHMFENLTCPPGPHDKTKIYAEDAPELYENVEIPVSTSHEDPYGGDNCKCECHNLDDHNLKSRSEHCVSCGTRFLNGRIYLQTSEGLRPAKITFPGGDDEKQEHITRVSLKTAERFVPATPTRRRKSSKNSPEQAETKGNKTSPTKESEDMDKLSSIKSKRANKIAMKTKERKKSPNIGGGDNSSEKKGPMSPVKTKREERAEKREAQDISRLKQTKGGYLGSGKSGKNLDSVNLDNASQSQTDDTSQDENSTSEYCRADDIEEESKLSTTNEDCTQANVSLEKMDVSSDSGSELGAENLSAVDVKPWTRQEDAILLECVKKEYSENTFSTVSETLGDRTVEEVKERFEILISLLAKMA